MASRQYPAATVRPVRVARPRSSAALVALAGALLPALLSYALATNNESRVLAAVIAFVGMVVVIARPFWGLIFFVALLYTRPEETIPAMQGMRLPLLISVVTLVALVIQNLLDKRPAVRSPLNGMMLGFGAVVVLSTAAGGDTATAVQDIAKLVILSFLVINLVSTPERYRGFVTALLVFTAYLAAYSIHLYLSGVALSTHDGERSQATGIFGDPNDLAATIVSGLALVLTRVRQGGGIARLAYAVLGVVMLWAILLTNSRGGMLSLLTVVGGCLLAFSKRRGPALLAAGLAAAAFLALGPDRMTTFDNHEGSANSRFWFWTTGVEAWLQRPLLGVGYGGFMEINCGMTAHNTFVLGFTETGTLGYFFWIGCIYYCFRRPGGLLAAGDPPADPPAAAVPAAAGLDRDDLLGARLALAGFLVAGFFLSRTYTPVLYLLFSLPVAQQVATLGPGRGYLVAPSERARDWGRILAVSLGSILLIYLFALKMR